MVANLRGYWLENNEQRYWVEVDGDGTLLAAEISVKAHDKSATMRRVVNKVTLARLQAAIRPGGACLVCGHVKEGA